MKIDSNLTKSSRRIAKPTFITPGISSSIRLIGLCLATAALLSSSACNGTPSATTSIPPTRPPRIPSATPHTQTPTDTPTQMPSPTPTLLSPVTLEEPENGACFDFEERDELRWSCPYELQNEEFYRLSITEHESSPFYLEKNHFPLSTTLSPGKYEWTVAIVRRADSSEDVLLSKESDRYSFEIAPPSPVVSSILPTSVEKGDSVQAIISGENFTRSHSLTIGVPLQMTFVDSTTIETIIPATLDAGVYPVVVQDERGKGVSSVHFTVNEPPTPCPQAVWNPSMPIPTAPPGYDPHQACVVPRCALAPQLVEPENGAKITVGSKVELKWEWPHCLPNGWSFAIRLSVDTPPHSQLYLNDPTWVSCEGGKSVGHFPMEIPQTPGTYYWNIAVTRSTDGTWERLSEESEIRSLVVFQPGENDGCSCGECPNPPCDDPCWCEK